MYLDGEKTDIRAGVFTLSGYSAHADQKDLLNFIKRMRYRPEIVRIVHGDNEAKRELKARVLEELPDIKALIPFK